MRSLLEAEAVGPWRKGQATPLAELWLPEALPSRPLRLQGGNDIALLEGILQGLLLSSETMGVAGGKKGNTVSRGSLAVFRAPQR